MLHDTDIIQWYPIIHKYEYTSNDIISYIVYHIPISCHPNIYNLKKNTANGGEGHGSYSKPLSYATDI